MTQFIVQLGTINRIIPATSRMMIAAAAAAAARRIELSLLRRDSLIPRGKSTGHVMTMPSRANTHHY